ncbi:hypothetical protein MRB53_023271 [Persea americana]|uniref:Uncharacterized protein n=1 Tax=Persea americana TaxID=3435 RepID=A0ACC2L9H2_PERAE|nr:hypothetical protein MRB53_023271 [Persea americana]
MNTPNPPLHMHLRVDNPMFGLVPGTTERLIRNRFSLSLTFKSGWVQHDSVFIQSQGILMIMVRYKDEDMTTLKGIMRSFQLSWAHRRQ